MNVYFRKLFSFRCFHDYYTGRACPDLRIEPTDRCAALLADRRMHYKADGQGGSVALEHYNAGTETVPVWKPVIDPEKGMVFTFKVVMKNPLFFNITDAVLADIGSRSAFVFANSAASPVSEADGNQVITLQEGALIGPIKTIGSAFSYTVPAALSPVSISLHRESGERVDGAALNPCMNSAAFNLKGEPEGIYEVRNRDGSGAVLKTDRFFVSDAFSTPHLLGFIQVKLLQSVMDHIDALHVFTLSFKNRAIKWKYKLKLKKAENGGEIETSKLALENAPVNFSRTLIATAPDEPKRVDFLSDDVIALKEKPYTGIGLQLLPCDGEDGTKKMNLIKNMPNPEIHRLVKDGVSGLRSEMHVNVKIKKEV